MGGLPERASRIDLLSLVEDVGKRGLDLSSTEVRVLRHYIWRSRDDDYQPGRICAVWDRVCRTAEKLDLSGRAINAAERELEGKGLITRTTGGNGARSGLRSHGLIRWAAGINLAPLIDRYAELKSLWEAHCLQLQTVAECKAEIRRLRRLIREGGSHEQMAQADAILPDGRVAPIHRIERLEVIRAGLEAVLAELGDGLGEALDDRPRAIKTSDRSEENGLPNIQTHNSSRTYSAHRREPTITPPAALSLASSDYRDLLGTMFGFGVGVGLGLGLGVGATGDPGWLELVETSRQMASAMGISQRT